MSDAATRDAQTAFARTLVDEWVRHGVRHAALAPGSRSTPLALALARDGRIRLEVFVDERSAAFCALGTAKASGLPAVVLCTSGTAAAHFHAAVLEAHHSRTPLLVCTADRPPELRDVGAGQTIDQTKLYGDAFARCAPRIQPHAVRVDEDLLGRLVEPVRRGLAGERRADSHHEIRPAGDREPRDAQKGLVRGHRVRSGPHTAQRIGQHRPPDGVGEPPDRGGVNRRAPSRNEQAALGR